MRSSAIFFVSVVTRTRSPRSARRRISSIRSSTCPLVGRTWTSGSISPVGRTTCSTTWLLTRSSYDEGVALMNTTCCTRSVNSWNCNGRLSRADGSRNP